jgi:ribosomal protein L11 methyltransferase
VSWLELSVRVAEPMAADAVESIAAVLEQFGALAVALQGGDAEEEVVEPQPGEQPLWTRVVFAGLFEPELDIRGLGAALAGRGARIVDVAFIEDADWRERWKAHAVTACFGGRLWLAPRGTTPAQAGPPLPVLHLEPGLAFGSGSHPTTRLCLSWLAEAPVARARILDFGCGSGILALAACLLEAAAVTAVDHDPQALVATRDNAAYNGVAAGQLSVTTPDALAGSEDEQGAYDVVIANILANPLVELAEALCGYLAPSGYLVLSGLLHAQEDRIRNAYSGIDFYNVAMDGDWIRMDGVRRRGSTGAAGRG